ncbi:Hypothetical_protein [Hexamita inflata]|uniref:Hypothetical_protein n=1 Tax=Hexamita inflata TaxID=28002 RepID=A0AA86NT85_9EUKA|nr:Hypothetical protein HINF_LOCUS12056 [Hexamita inflata]
MAPKAYTFNTTSCSNRSDETWADMMALGLQTLATDYSSRREPLFRQLIVPVNKVPIFGANVMNDLETLKYFKMRVCQKLMHITVQITGFQTREALRKKAMPRLRAAALFYLLKPIQETCFCDKPCSDKCLFTPPPFLTCHVSRTRCSEMRFLAELKEFGVLITVLEKVGLEIDSRVSRRWVHSKLLLVQLEAMAACFGRRTTCVTHYASAKLLAITFQTHSISTAAELSLRV